MVLLIFVALRKRFSLILIAVVFLLVCRAGLVMGMPIKPVVPDRQTDLLVVTDSLQYLEDKQSRLTADDVLAPKNPLAFVNNGLSALNFGYTDSTYWVRFRIDNPHEIEFNWVLEVAYAPLDFVDVYILDDNGVEEMFAGDTIPFSSRDIAFPTAAFFFETQPKQTQWVYLRVRSSSSMQIPINLWNQKAFVGESVSRIIFWGIYFGALFVAAGFNLFLYITLRDKVYIFYIAFVLSVMLFQFAVRGFASQLLWPNNTELSNYVTLLSLNLMGATTALFTIFFLKLSETLPKVFLVLCAFVACFILDISLIGILPYSVLLKVSIFLFSVGAIILIVSAGLCWRAGYTPARIYVMAWAAMLIGVVVFSLKTLGFIEANFITNNAATFGSAIEVFLLSLAIGDRINLERNERKEVQQKLMATQNELLEANNKALTLAKQSDQIKQQFLSTMSHELRTPLNGILGCTQLLKVCGNHNDDEKHTVEYLASSAKQMLGHVNRILNFSQLYEGKLVKQSYDFKFHDLEKYLKDNYEQLCLQKAIGFEFSAADGIREFYRGDKEKILLVLGDVVENAIKFTSKGMVKISVTEKNSGNADEDSKQLPCLEFQISDTGCGIEKNYLKDLYEMFSQQDGSFNRKQEGLGLGLAICRKYIEILEGAIECESSVGKGSTFTIRFPVEPCLQETEVCQEHSSSVQSSANSQILIVEDNPTNQIILQKMLKKEGLKSELAENGAVALELLSNNHFDLVLMDCHMPIMDGFEATQRIRGSATPFQHVPIVAVTANSMAGDRERCLQAGMNDYIAKPYSRDTLRQKLALWLADTQRVKAS